MPLPVLFDAKKRCEISFEYVGINCIILPAFFMRLFAKTGLLSVFYVSIHKSKIVKNCKVLVKN